MPPMDDISAPPSNNSVDEITITSSFDTLSTTDHSYSTSHTILGPGALSGKAIHALGKATLRVVENLTIRTKIQTLSSRFPHRDRDDIKGIQQMYGDLMEFSRRDIYPGAVRTRALHMILVQIGSREVEKLIQYLAIWSSIELRMFLDEITELFDPIRLLKAIGCHPKLVQAYRNSLIQEYHCLEPLITFLHRLACSSNRIAAIVLEAGVVELIVHLHISNYSDPLAAAKANLLSGNGSTVRLACKALLSICLNTERGLNIISRHRLHPLLPALPALQFADSLSRQAQRAKAWQVLETEVVLFRAQSISKMMVIEDYWQDAPERESLEEIFADISEFYKPGIYHQDVRNHILQMFSQLVGSRKTEKIVCCVSMWPSTEIQSLISWLTNTFNILRSFNPGSIILFLSELAQTTETAIQAILEGGSLNFLLELYLMNFRDLQYPFGHFYARPNLQELCDSLLRICWRTERGLKLISKHQLYVIWPTIQTSPFSNTLFEQRVERAKIWRSTNPKFIDLRLKSILNVIWAKPPYPLKSRSLADIVEDTLEFFVHEQYGDVVKAHALDIILALVGGRRTEELIHRLTTTSPMQTGLTLLMSEIAEVFNPLRLYIMKQADKLPSSVKVYRDSISASETHSLQPLVTFFEQIAVRSAAPQVAATEFLHHLCLSDFFDPLSKKLGHVTNHLTVHTPCHPRLLTYVNSKVDMGLSVVDSPFHAPWSLQPPCVTASEFPSRLAERARIWESTNTESVLFRIHLIFFMIPAIWKEAMENRRSLIPILAIADLMEFLGYSSRVSDISYYALECFCSLLSYSLPFGSTIQVIYCDLALGDTDYYSTLIVRIFQQLLYWQQTLDAKGKLSLLRRNRPGFCVEDFSVFGMRGILQVIDFFIEAARDNPRFLDVILEANILGLLRPFLEQEFRSDTSPIATHDRDVLMTYDASDFEILALIGKRGLGELLPDSGNDNNSGSTRRAVLSHAFEVLLS